MNIQDDFNFKAEDTLVLNPLEAEKMFIGTAIYNGEEIEVYLEKEDIPMCLAGKQGSGKAIYYTELCK